MKTAQPCYHCIENIGDVNPLQHGGACPHTCPPEVRSSGDNTDFRAGRFGDATEAQASGGELRTSSRRSGKAV